MTPGFRFVRPSGKGEGWHQTAAEARRAAVLKATSRSACEAVSLEDDQVAVLWRQLERAGWRVEMVRPAGSLTR